MSTEPAPPTAQVPTPVYEVGIGYGRIADLHAIRRTDIRPTHADAAPNAATVCGERAILMPQWTSWDACAAARNISVCPACLWAIAITEDATGNVLTALTPGAAEAAVLAQTCGDPAPTATVCRAILAANDQGRDNTDLTLQLLVHATRHRPFVAVAEDCADLDCEHEQQPADCYRSSNTVLCGACSVTAGPWAGEWEGQIAIECTVNAPCSAFVTLARHHGVTVTVPAVNGAVA